MAAPEKIFRDALMADAAVATFFAGRVYTLRVPQGTPVPHARLAQVAERRDGTLTGPDVLPSALIELQVVGDTLLSASEGRDLVRTRMDALTTSDIAICRLDNQTTDFGDDTNFARVIMDFRMIYKEA